MLSLAEREKGMQKPFCNAACAEFRPIRNFNCAPQEGAPPWRAQLHRWIRPFCGIVADIMPKAGMMRKGCRMERFETAGRRRGWGGVWLYNICHMYVFLFHVSISYIILKHITSPPIRNALSFFLAPIDWVFLPFPLSILLLKWRNASHPSPIPTSWINLVLS